MKRILLTGASGFLASRFYDFYKNKYEIIPFTSKDLDVTNKNEVISALKNYSPDYVINTAGIISTTTCEQYPEKAFEVNVNGNINIALGCKAVNSKMIYLSTEQVYNGHTKKGPFKEDDISSPVTVYGNQKLQGEIKAREILDDNLWILRMSWLFGLPERNKKIGANILWNVIKASLMDMNIELPINEYRGMTYVYDIIEKITDVFEIPYGVYNFGSSNNLNTYETGKFILDLLQTQNPVIKMDTNKYKDCTRDLRMNIDKISSMGIHFESTKNTLENCLKEYCI